MTFIREEIKGAKLKDSVQLILPVEERQIKVSPNLNFLKRGRLLHTDFFQLIFQCATSCRGVDGISVICSRAMQMLGSLGS
jgi:hypothetical protein